MIIDSHTHGLYGKYFDPLIRAGGEWAKRIIDKSSRMIQERPQYSDIGPRVEQLDRYGIDLQVVTAPHGLDSNIAPGGFDVQLAVSRAMNDNMARMMEDSKGRLVTVGNVPLSNFEQGGRQEMERALKTLGLKGITLCTNFEGKPLDLPEFEPFWACAEEMNVTVYIHPNHPAGHSDRSYEADYDLIHTFGWPFETVLAFSRLVFSKIMERYPMLKVVSHHLGGGMIPFFMGRIEETYEPEGKLARLGDLELSKPLFHYFSRFYYDTAAGGSGAPIKCAHEVFGADQLLFATDAPHGPGKGETRLKEYPKLITSLGFSESDNKKIFEDNARRLLNLNV